MAKAYLAGKSEKQRITGGADDAAEQVKHIFPSVYSIAFAAFCSDGCGNGDGADTADGQQKHSLLVHGVDGLVQHENVRNHQDREVKQVGAYNIPYHGVYIVFSQQGAGGNQFRQRGSGSQKQSAGEGSSQVKFYSDPIRRIGDQDADGDQQYAANPKADEQLLGCQIGVNFLVIPAAFRTGHGFNRQNIDDHDQNGNHRDTQDVKINFDKQV